MRSGQNNSSAIVLISCYSYFRVNYNYLLKFHLIELMTDNKSTFPRACIQKLIFLLCEDSVIFDHCTPAFLIRPHQLLINTSVKTFPLSKLKHLPPTGLEPMTLGLSKVLRIMIKIVVAMPQEVAYFV